MSLTKATLITTVSEKTGFTKKQAETAVEAVFDSMSDVLRSGGDIRLPIMIAKIKDVPARDARNPKTGEKLKVAATRKLSIKPGAFLKDSIVG